MITPNLDFNEVYLLKTAKKIVADSDRNDINPEALVIIIKHLASEFDKNICDLVFELECSASVGRKLPYSLEYYFPVQEKEDQ